MEYQVVEDSSQNVLASKVNDLIGQGWTPQGGVSVAGWTNSWENDLKGYTESETIMVYAQAMVRVPS